MSKWLTHTEPIGECLIWTRCLNTDGYPRANVGGNPNIKVHREVFKDVYGYLPEVVRHSCDNPKCINPAHLIGGTATSNMNDRRERGRTNGHVSVEEIEKIRNLRLEGKTHKQIAAMLSCKVKRIAWVQHKYL